MARDIQNADPNSAESLRRAEQEEALIATDACWGRSNQAVIQAAKGIYDIAAGAALLLVPPRSRGALTARPWDSTSALPSPHGSADSRPSIAA